jgi:hypothetical protein
MVLIMLRSSNDKGDISEKWRRKTCCRGPPSTKIDGATYLFLGEQTSQNRELTWGKTGGEGFGGQAMRRGRGK